ncbi:MAG: dihydropteroate synthase [Bacteroidota bacterium]|jgi:dihydropteroate synthase
MIELNSRGRSLKSSKPLVMGVLNCTDDSFYEASRMAHFPVICRRIDDLIGAGVDIIDIGGKSTKPGSVDITALEEIERIGSAIDYLVKHENRVWSSIDTTSADVARFAIEKGIDIVNDVSGGNMDLQMIPTVASLGVPFVCTHMQGIPATMQENPQYEDVTEDLIQFFKEKINHCHQAGIREIILDPGFGFGKSLEHNYTLVSQLEKIVAIGQPIMVGFSRKSMIYKLLKTTPDEALNGTTVLNAVALMKGASVLRVHDAREAIETVKIIEQIKKA